MKKENKKLAQERRAAQRKKIESRKKISKMIAFWLPVIVIAIVIIVLVWAVATSGSASSDTGTEGTEDANRAAMETLKDELGGSTTNSDDADASDSQSDYIETEGTVCENGDTVVIDYSGSVDGEVFEGGTAQNQQLTLGSGSFIDGFEDAIIGHTVGESFDINVTFPDPYPNNPDLAGKEAVFAITIHGVYKAQ